MFSWSIELVLCVAEHVSRTRTCCCWSLKGLWVLRGNLCLQKEDFCGDGDDVGDDEDDGVDVDVDDDGVDDDVDDDGDDDSDEVDDADDDHDDDDGDDDGDDAE